MKKKKENNGIPTTGKALIATTAIATQQILLSFGNSALAECGGYGGNVCLTITSQDFCAPDNTAVTHSFDIDLDDTTNNEGYYPTVGTMSSAANQVSPFDNFAITPANLNFNAYPGGPPTPVTNLSYDFNFTTPDIPANSGPISLGNGRRQYVVDLHAEAEIWDDFNSEYTTYPGGLVIDDSTLTITVDHVNTAPVIDNLTQPQTVTVPDLNATIDFEVTADISDIEANTADLVFELSDDPGFSNILQTGSYPGELLSTSAQSYSHTWTDLTVDDYYWRISATETDAEGHCVGFGNEVSGNNFAVNATSTEVLVHTADGPTPTTAVLPETSITDSAFEITDIGFITLIIGMLGLTATITRVLQKYNSFLKLGKNNSDK